MRCRKLTEGEAKAEHERTKNNLVFLGELVLLEQLDEGGKPCRLMVGEVFQYQGDSITCRFAHPGFCSSTSTRHISKIVKMEDLADLAAVECMEMKSLVKSRYAEKVHRIASVHLCHHVDEAAIMTDAGICIPVKDVEPLSQQELLELLSEQEDDEKPLSSMRKRARVGK